MHDQQKIISQLIKRTALRSLAAVRLALILLLGLIFWVPAARAQATADSDKSLKKVTLQLKWHHQFQFAGYYAAVEKGYYSDAGLEVLLKEGRSGMSLTDEVVSGRADFGIDMPIILLERLVKGKPVVVLAAIFQHSPEIIIARRDSGIESPQDLVARRLELRSKGNIESRAMLINEGIQLEDIVIVDHSWDINDLVSKKVDASAGYITDRPFMLEQQGVPYTVINPLTYGIDFYGDCLFTSEMVIKEQPERVRAFYEASLQGWAYAMENPDEIIEIILTKYTPGLSKEFLRFEAQAMQKLMLPELVELGHMNQGRWKHIGDTFVQLGMLKPDFSLKGFIYDSNPKPDYKWIYWTIGIIGTILLIVGLCVVILIIFNLRLKKSVRLQTLELSETNQKLVNDITKRKRVEESLQEAHKRLLAILDGIDALVYVSDIDTYELLFVNRYGRDIWGEIQGSICWKTLQNDQTGPCDFCTNKYLLDSKGQPNEPYTWEFQNTVNGHSYYISDRAIRWIDGRLVRLEIATDITKHRTLEVELLKAQKLESIGVLAGGIAHDFNNLLTAILNNLFLMKKHIRPEEKVYERIIATERATARAQSLTQQLLTFSKGGAPIKELINIRELVSESISIALRGSNVRCENLIPDDVWNIEADAGQMNQAINNILINADQSMPEGGTITINCDNVVVRAENSLTLKEGNYTKLSIRDQGTGISDEYLSRIFDPYFTTKQKGSGLGLSSAYSIIKNHDGHIDVKSELGVGTVFNMYLPASMEKVKIKKPAEDEPVTGTGKVLIMDDEELVRDSLGQILIHIGYVVEFACDGREAVDMYKNAMASDHPFDAVIMDLTIPGGMGGKDAIRELIEIDPHVKAIVSSGYSYDSIMSNYTDYGFSSVITKPFKDIWELDRILNNVIDGKVK